MPNRSIRVHRCTHPDLDNGIPFSCSCVSRVSRKEALEYIAAGKACWKKIRRFNGSVVESERELIFFTKPRFPRAKTISNEDIEFAFVDGGTRERERIERYPEYDFASDRQPVVNKCSLGVGAVLAKPK